MSTGYQIMTRLSDSYEDKRLHYSIEEVVSFHALLELVGQAIDRADNQQRIEDLALRLGIIEQEDLPEPEDMDGK